MPLYGVAQAGSNPPPNQGLNLTSLIPGDFYELFTGAETPVQGMTSVAINRGIAPAFVDNGITFYINGGPAGAKVAIQGANIDTDADYFQLDEETLDSNGAAVYTDTGRAAFYRVKLTAYTSGPMPIVTVQR